ncbi:CAP-Gly domain-containing linker protein 4-like [Ischnura elegans]|uniref:CAP-Gly domain-containing linker protein 4-like n=1 Tax=Ischnura elegans TaxID=197161 RepID=UPI001ED86862|nr:CAP-Gly domain-containing linker protein 4-like [Ischnura elegans]
MVAKGNTLEKRPEYGLRLKGRLRTMPTTHPPVDAPLCSGCGQFDLSFFDPSCPGCLEIITNPTTTIAEIFAVLRQWVPQTQRNIGLFAEQIIQRGAHVDDRDGLTDMTLLHYACRAGAGGVGDIDSALKVVNLLINKGANAFLTCKWTKMSALHYAAFFDVDLVVKALLERCKGLDVNSPCPSYDNGTSLHICAMNLCVDTAHILLEHGADLSVKDKLSRTPIECIADKSSFGCVPDITERITRMQTLLKSKKTHMVQENGKTSLGSITGKTVLKAMNFSLNERVVVGGSKTGILRYCGSTEFAPGFWAGVELDSSEGKNDGSVNGVQYFKCPRNHGIFAPIDRVTKASVMPFSKMSISKGSRKQIDHGKIDISHVTSKVSSGLTLGNKLKEIRINDKVVVRRNGISGEIEELYGLVRYIGLADFASGVWIGVELEKEAEGRHDGSVDGKRYFSCPPQRGIMIPGYRIKRLSTKPYANTNAIDTTSSQGGNHQENIWEANCTSSMKKDLLVGLKTGPLYSHGFRRKNLLRSLSVGHSSTVSPVPSLQQRSGRCDILKRSRSCEDRGPTVSIGMNALYNHKIGIVKYIGPVEFADGNWIGLELRENKGKHDGIVNGKRYFTSKPGHGIMVQCKHCTIRGINGEKLIGS